MNEIHLKVFGLQTIEIKFLLVAFKINCRVFGIYANVICCLMVRVLLIRS